MTGGQLDQDGELTLDEVRAAASLDDLARILRRLRRREARGRGDSQLSYRELAAKTGWAHGVIGDYFSGRTLAPTDRFDVLVGLLGATPQELGALATARDRVEEKRRESRLLGGTTQSSPDQLPSPATGLVGRQALLAQADELLGDGEAQTGTRIMVICGTAGVGKTALALHWARRIESRFPDGSLYVDLRGYGSAEPMAPETALIGLLRSLGAAELDLAAEAGELAARYRSLVAGKRMIIMLDNARSAEQIRPLLPGTPSALALVTSRDHLAGLVARDGAARIAVPLLAPGDAVKLLHSLIGERVTRDVGAAQALANRCARLPLALRIAAELAARRPQTEISDLVAELGEASLDLLDAGGDTETAVRQIFSWSYRHLSPGAARCFRALGLFPGTQFEVPVLAALAGLPLAQAQQHTEELVRTSLAEPGKPARYTMHDLLRAYAKEQADDDTELAGHATDRLLEHYLHTCGAAVATLYPGEYPGVAESDWPGPQTALAWLETELPTIVALSRESLHNGRFAFVTGVSERLWPYLDRSGRYPEAATVHGNALTAARAQGDPRLEAVALGELGQANVRQGRYREALGHLHQALELSRRAADPAREATTLNSISIALSRLGRSQEAIDHLHQALARHRGLGNRIGEGKVLSNLGIEYAQMGRYRAALEHFGLAVEIARERGDRYGEGNALNNLGLVSCWLGRYEEALAHHETGLQCARDTADRAGEGRVLANLGVSHTRIGNHQEALACLTQAWQIHVEVGDRAAEAEALTYLGDLSQATGAYATALQQHQHALAVAGEIGYRHVRGPAHNGAAKALWELGRRDEAAAGFRAALQAAEQTNDRLQRGHALVGLARGQGQGEARALLHQAAAIYAELGVPELDDIRRRLQALG